jgi:hypothetical protein
MQFEGTNRPRKTLEQNGTRSPFALDLDSPVSVPRHGTVFATIRASKGSATPEPVTPEVSPPLRAFRPVRRTAYAAARPDHPPATSKTRGITHNEIRIAGAILTD